MPNLVWMVKYCIAVCTSVPRGRVDEVVQLTDEGEHRDKREHQRNLRREYRLPVWPVPAPTADISTAFALDRPPLRLCPRAPRHQCGSRPLPPCDEQQAFGP